MMNPKYLTRLDQVPQLEDAERASLAHVTDRFVFRANDYYLSLIDWDDPDDPIRRIVLPHADELMSWGALDASHEGGYTRVPGLEHKYSDTALLLCNDVCGAYCRFCFRKRLFMDGNEEVVRDIGQGVQYIREHPEISDVLLSGGDPLVMSTRKLSIILDQLADIPHVRVVRIGTKMLGFNPYRVLADDVLVERIGRAGRGHQQLYVMAHFNHPRELTDVALDACHRLQEVGVALVNQTPMIRGVNDDARVLGELFRRLAFNGIPPYYVFQCRPTAGNRPYTIPIESTYRVVEEAKRACSGLARRARLVMSHCTGKIEIMGVTDEHILFKYHRAADPANESRVVIRRRNPEAYWFDDYQEPDHRRAMQIGLRQAAVQHQPR